MSFNMEIDGQSYFIKPGTFVEGAIRRQAEFQQLDSDSLKSKPDNREWLQTSWIGGAEWAKPIYSPTNIDTYFNASGVSLTDSAGSVQQSATIVNSDSDLRNPSSAFVSWNKNGIEGAVSLGWTGTAWAWFDWDTATSNFTVLSVDHATLVVGDYVMAAAAGPASSAYSFMKSGYLAEINLGTNALNLTNLNLSAYNGSNIWVDATYVWIYNGESLYRWNIDRASSPELIVNDGDGPDTFSTSATFTSKPIIPEWSNRRAIRTAEGFFYIKNVLVGGLTVCKVYRIDRDNAGSYINTPLASLSAGATGLDLAYHLSSLMITTVANSYTATNNTEDQRVTIYHVTGNSVGAIGSPLGGDNLDETPVWFLGAIGEQYFFGGRKRIWQYDPRVGAFHPWLELTDTKYTDHGAGVCDMVDVKLGTSSGTLFKHASQDGLAVAPYIISSNQITSTNTNSKNSFLESNWIDFNMPMEEKSITEVYYDSAFLRTDSTVTIQIAADDGAYSTVLTLTGGTSADTARTTIASVKGFKFRYKLIFSDDTDVTSLDPSRIRAIGFGALAGEMVEVMQFTIDGNESMNINNAVQDPKDVYDSIALLRDNSDSFTVKHYYHTNDLADSVTRTMRVASITGSKDWPGEGLYDIVLIEVSSV